MSLLLGLLYMDDCPFPSPVKLRPANTSRNRSALLRSKPPPASRHITAGHFVNPFEALPYVYSIIFHCHDHKAGLPRSVQFNFSMGPHW